MKHFDLDWGVVLRSLPAWERLDPKARKRLLSTLKPTGEVPARDLGDSLDALRLAGLVEVKGVRVAVPEPMLPLVAALRGMNRHHTLLRVATAARLVQYLEEHYTGQELQSLQTGLHLGRFSSGWVDRQMVAQEVSSADWLEAFLELESKAEAKRWEEGHRRRGDRPLLGTLEAFEATKRLIETLLPHPAGLPLRDLPAAVQGVSGPILGASLHAALHYLFCFAVLDAETLDPYVGLWPPAAARLRAAPLTPPEPVEPVEAFHAALLMEDMTAVLVAASGEPLRLRGSDYAIFARQQQAIAERLVAVPPWVEKALGLRVEHRISVAAHLLRTLEMARVAGEEGTDLRLEPTRTGSRWLALSDHDRLAALLEPLRASKERNPTGRYYHVYRGPEFEFFPQRVPMRLPDDHFDTRIALADAFLSKSASRFLPLEDFLDYHSRMRNPFLQEKQHGRLASRPGFGGYSLARREDLERLWEELLQGFLVQRLLVLGGARVGRTAEGLFCFSITDIGWYLFDGVEDFRYGHDVQAEVVVQPNFEIVFLTPAPLVEAQLARFAERTGAGPGVMFRLTRASVLAAAEAGMSADQVLDTLRKASSRALPANVERQIRDWFGTVRRIALRHTVLIRCPDEETALRVRAAAGADARPLTDTVLELTNSAAPAKRALLRKLRKEGVFVEG